MPDLLEREKHEGAVNDALRRIAPEQRERIEQILGFPPDPSRLTPEVIRQLEREMQDDEVRAALALVFLLAMGGMSTQFRDRTGIAVTESAAGRDAAQYAARRSQELAQDFTAHTSESLRRGAQEAQELIVTGDEAGARDRWQESLDTAFGEDRVDRASVTETTGANTAGEQRYVDRVQDRTAFTMLAIWVTESDDRVCPICRPVHRQPQNRWEAVHGGNPDFARAVQSGPPAHPRCRCWLSYAVITQEEAANLRLE